jgi:hypothetical protein
MAIGLYELALAVVLGYSALGWLVLTGIKINYGRLSASLSKVYVSPRIGWFLFEIPNLLWAAYFLLWKGDAPSLPYLLFIMHYLNRDILYPLRLQSVTKVPLEILLSAFTFTAANGYLQGLANQAPPERLFWLVVAGTALFIAGMWVNVHSDNILQEAKQKLLKEGNSGQMQGRTGT